MLSRSRNIILGAVMLLFNAMFSFASVETDLLAHWRLDEAGSDTSVDNDCGDYLNGTRVGATNGQSGVIDGAYGFQDTYVALSGSLDLGGNQATFSVWLNPSEYRSGDTFTSRMGILGDRNYKFWFNMQQAGKVGFSFHDGTAYRSLYTDAGAVGVDEWSHVVCTRDGTTLHVYVNGVLMAETQDAGTDSFQIQNTVDLGRVNSVNSRSFLGDMDDLGVWTRSLTQKEIAAVAGLGRFSAISFEGSQIDEIIAMDSIGQSVVVGTDIWEYTETFAAPASGETLVVGLNYLSTDGDRYIVLEDNEGVFSGVISQVPEPSSLILLGVSGFIIYCKRNKKY